SAKEAELEFGGGAKLEELGFVEIFFGQHVGEVGAERTDRRVPDQAAADRGAQRLGVLNINTQFAGIGAIDRASVGEHGAAKSEFIRQEREGETNFNCSSIEGFAAQGIGLQFIARTKASHLETADCLTAFIEGVDNAYILAIPAKDGAADAAANEDKFL